jgi:hypothetical protein
LLIFGYVSLDVIGNTRHLPAHSLYLLLMTSVYLTLFIPFWKPLISSKLFYTNSISLYNTSSHTTSKPRYIFPSGIPTCILICREIFQFCDLVMLLIIFLCAVSSFMCSHLPFQKFSCCHCFSLLFSNIHYIGVFFLIHLSLYIIISEFLIETMLTKLCCSHPSGLNTVLPHFYFILNIRLDISFQSLTVHEWTFSVFQSPCPFF